MRKRATKKATQQEFLQVLHCELVHLRAAVITAALALDGSGVHDYVATLLRGHSLARLEPIMKTLDELAHK